MIKAFRIDALSLIITHYTLILYSMKSMYFILSDYMKYFFTFTYFLNLKVNKYNLHTNLIANLGENNTTGVIT